ncbi:hypothetical protein BGZ57DRAFT_342795 [Hyaloscypha finlandica]|nr:hypothetical protein BGZ57DRAFT_342795 [Hyaloscypha finlandica]
MASATQKTDEYAFNIQLDTGIEDRDYHGRNKKDEIQRPDIVDDYCQGLLLQARVDRVVHGTEKKGGTPATLVVFGFRFHGIGKKRRFKQSVITIVFQDEQKREDADPVVIFLWPNRGFTLGKPTDIAVDETKGGEAGGNAGATYGGVNAKATWEKKKSFGKTDRASLTGSIMLDRHVRNSGPANAVLLTVTEDETAQSGLVTDLRAVVLLRRQNDTDKFAAKVKIGAKANFFYDLVTGLRDVSGLSPANDPVVFKAGKEHNYIRPATLAGFLEDKLAEEVDEEELNSKSLDGLAGVLGCTALVTSLEE